MTNADTAFEVWISDPQGQRLALLDTITGADYVLAVNAMTAWRISIPDTLDRRLLRPDMLITLWRKAGAGRLIAEFAGFLRRWVFYDDQNGKTNIELTGPSILWLLDNRIIAYAAGTAGAAKIDYADDMIKAIIRENLGGSAIAARDLTGYGFSVQADVSLAASIERRFAWRNVLTTVITLAQASETAGTPLYFDLVPSWSADSVSIEFQTFINQRGTDRTYSGSQPLIFGREWGNLARPALVFDYGNERNYIYAGGQGEGTLRLVAEASSAARMGASVWNRRELFVQATNEQTSAELTDRADSALDEHAPKAQFSGDLLSVPGSLYGRDWFLGDKVTAQYAGYQFDAMISRVRVRLAPDGSETVSAKLEAEIAL